MLHPVSTPLWEDSAWDADRTGFIGGICTPVPNAGAGCSPLVKKSSGHKVIAFRTERRRKQKSLLAIIVSRLLCYNVRPWNTVLLWRGSMTPLRVSLRELKLGRISTLASWLPLYMVIQIWAEIPIPVTLMLTCVVPFLSVWILYPLTLPWTVTPPMPLGPERVHWKQPAQQHHPYWRRRNWYWN